jgi:hypothetical protein
MPSRRPSPKQLKLITDLQNELREMAPNMPSEPGATMSATEAFENFVEAWREIFRRGTYNPSEHIDALFAIKKIWKEKVRTPELEDAMYRNPESGKIFKVYHTVHGANQQVAKELVMLESPYTKIVRGKEVEVKAEFEYVGKEGLKGLTADMKMSREEALHFSAVYGVCVRCAATLTNETSIERAMGPVCYGKI